MLLTCSVAGLTQLIVSAVIGRQDIILCPQCRKFLLPHTKFGYFSLPIVGSSLRSLVWIERLGCAHSDSIAWERGQLVLIESSCFHNEFEVRGSDVDRSVSGNKKTYIDC